MPSSSPGGDVLDRPPECLDRLVKDARDGNFPALRLGPYPCR